jgi:hypothetical protein
MTTFYITDPPFREIDDVTSDMFNVLLDLNVTGYFRFSKVSILISCIV